MKQELESKDNSIQQLTTRESNLRTALDHTVSISVNQQDQINNLLRDNMSLQDENVQLIHTKEDLDNNNKKLQIHSKK